MIKGWNGTWRNTMGSKRTFKKAATELERCARKYLEEKDMIYIKIIPKIDELITTKIYREWSLTLKESIFEAELDDWKVRENNFNSLLRKIEKLHKTKKEEVITINLFTLKEEVIFPQKKEV